MIKNLLLCSKHVSANCIEVLHLRSSHLIRNQHVNKQKSVQWIAGVVWIFSVVLLGCEEPIKHDESLAGRRAKEFAEAGFIRQDFENAYSKLSDAAKRYVTLDNFKKTVAQLHPKGYPRKIAVIEFEPVPSEKKAIYIFLVGDTSGLNYYYRLMMEGNAKSDYKVSVFENDYSPYHASPLRKPMRAELGS